MYERPTLNRVGEAQDVILGYIPTGNDMDTNFVSSYLEYADDDENHEGTVPKV